ncbi:hypothetical protein B9Z44_07105 [Limnohabitans curvus]|uniref:Uncharacterized protein n=1 Tax=Limnohabitans curvus TaxID=323423 RepID=A0A315ERG8_9BURK|nr:hypothetical protein B9Z44_07105 [Limnohabitans curvus]
MKSCLTFDSIKVDVRVEGHVVCFAFWAVVPPSQHYKSLFELLAVRRIKLLLPSVVPPFVQEINAQLLKQPIRYKLCFGFITCDIGTTALIATRRFRKYINTCHAVAVIAEVGEIKNFPMF